MKLNQNKDIVLKVTWSKPVKKKKTAYVMYFRLIFLGKD